MKKESLISVIIPVYNVQDYLSRCVESVTKQSYTNLEIILVDDGSTDDCPNMCDDFAKKDKRIKVIHKENGGVSDARNLGIDVSTGDYLTFVDGDDFISQHMLKVLHDNLSGAAADVSICRYFPFKGYINPSMFDFNNQSIRILSSQSGATNMLYQRDINNAPGAKLYHRSLFNGVRFNPSVKYAEDVDMNYRLLIKARNIVFSSFQGYFYLQRDDNASAKNFSSSRMSGLNVMRKIMDDAKDRNSSLALAVTNRVFMEAIFIIIQMPDPASYQREYQLCVEVIDRYSSDVLRDQKSRNIFRLYALLSKMDVKCIVWFFKLKHIMLSGVR